MALFERVHPLPSPAVSYGEPQHLDRLLTTGEEPHPGSHRISPRRGFVHHGIWMHWWR